MERIFKIQQELKCAKEQRNEFGKYNYRSCEDIFEAVKPLLNREKLILVMSDELVQIGERYYIKATANIYDYNKTLIISNTAYAREEEVKKGMDGSQITGASSSYARKYALNGLFLIDDVKDSDTTNTGADEIKTKEQAENYKLTFGKHEGKTIKEIVETQRDYANWLYKNGDDTIKKCLNLMLENKEVIPDYNNGYAPKFNEN